jgi:hypothetical protein
MVGQAQSISPQQRYSRLRNWFIGLAVTAAGVITSYFWLDQPIAFFVHRNVADKMIADPYAPRAQNVIGYRQAAHRIDESASYYYTYEDRHQRLDIPLP